MNNTIAQKVKQFTINAARVCDLLQWEPGVYQEHQFETAINYLVEYFNDEEAVNKLSKQPAFWGWWVNQWDERNEAFLGEMEFQNEYGVEKLRQLYKASNMPESLAAEIAPPTAIYPKDFTTIKMQLANI